MKSKLVAIAGSFASVCVAMASMPVNAERVNNTLSGSNLCLEASPDSSCTSAVSHSVSIPLKNSRKNLGKSKYYNKPGTTIVGHSGLTVVTPTTDPTTYCLIDGQQGSLYIYDYSTQVGTTPDGDLIVTAMDDTTANTVCVHPTGYFDVTIHSTVIGGSGRYTDACGSLEFNGRGVFLPPPGTDFSAFEGTQVGEILTAKNCP
ncbi:MAG: hypothetical protein H6987_18720 [Pseudomonadales bacterium]|nr:hypothetical protein [Pseudomonadales bacterium]